MQYKNKQIERSEMFKKIGYFVMFFVLLLITFFAVGKALAYENIINGDTKIKGGLSVAGDLYADHNNLFFNPIGYSGVDPTIDFKRGNSLIKEMGDLYVTSDDYVHIGANHYDAGRVLIQSPSDIRNKSRGANGILETGKIYINNEMNFSEGAVVDFSNADVTGLTPLSDYADELDAKVSVAGDTMTGVLHADSGIDVNYGNFTINPDGSSYISGNMTLSGNAILSVNNTSFLYGGINIPAGGFVVNPDGDIFTEGAVDFSGASMTRVTNSASAPACGSSQSGAVYFNTTSHNFYGCDGTSWVQFN